jgi:PTS system ascorbate-specific IIB component
MKIITVCGMGIGTSVLLKMNTDRALERLGVDGDVEAADIGTAKGAASLADLVLTSADVVPGLDGLSTPVRVITDFMDVDEITAVITEALDL